MGKRIKYAAIPRGNEKQAIAALTNIAETMTGAKGDKLEKAVTFRDLERLDIVEIKRSLNGQEIFLENPPSNPSDPVIEIPTQPTGFNVVGGFTSILLSWDFPTYEGHAFTEVWRSEDTVLGNASRLITVNGISFSDIAGNNFTGYYWIRHVNTNGVEGPFHDTAGIMGQTAEDVEFNLAVLNGRIAEIHLNSFLGSKIDLVDINAGLIQDNLNLLINDYYTKLSADAKIDEKINTFNSTVLSPTYATNATLTTAYRTAADTDIAISTATQALRSEVIGFDYATNANLTTNYITAAQTTNAISGAITQFQTNVLGPNYVTNATLTTSYRTESDTDSAIAAAVDQFGAQIFDNQGQLVGSFITQVTNTQASAVDGAISQAFTDYTVNYSGQNYSLTQLAQVSVDVSGDYEIQWGVKTNVSDIEGGIGLYDNGTVIQATVLADRFAVVDPRDNTVRSMFTVVTNDPVLPDGVYIDTAFIKAATIQDLVAGSVVADEVVANIDLIAPNITGGLITGSTFRGATVELIGSTFMEVTSPSGFGPDNLWKWIGPRILDVNGAPNLSALTRDNAFEWRDINLNGYYGGSIRADIIRNSAQTTVLTLNPSLEIGPFTTNGANKQIKVDMNWSYFDSRVEFSPETEVNISETNAGTVLVERSINGSAYTQVNTVQLTYDYVKTSTQEGAEYIITEQEIGGGSIEYTDTNSSTNNFKFRLTVQNQNRHRIGNPQSQTLTFASVEQNI